MWQFENALRDECGYPGYQPYWDWTTHADDMKVTPLFNGSALSLGGNGAPVVHAAVNATVPGVPVPQFIPCPPGSGGGCVVGGPWDNFTVTLGPVTPYGAPNATGYEYNRRCLKRDFLQTLSSTYLNAGRVTDLLTTSTMADFRRLLDDTCHFSGHSSVGGDLTDIFTSPNDPIFYFHHAQIDRVWAIWQSADVTNRTFAVSDTVAYNNSKCRICCLRWKFMLSIVTAA